MKLVRDAMTPDPRTVGEQDSVVEAARVMEQEDIGSVPVVDNDGATLPCWTVVSPNGRFLYNANAGNGTVSAFDLRSPEAPRHLQTITLRRGANPWGLALDPPGRTLFVVDPRAVGGVSSVLGNRLHVLTVGSDGRLSEINGARQVLPVGGDASPLGIAVVPRS